MKDFDQLIQTWADPVVDPEQPDRVEYRLRHQPRVTVYCLANGQWRDRKSRVSQAVRGPDDQYYESISAASRALQVAATTIRGWARKKVNGWRFDENTKD
jgi:hypothetical protein